MVITKIKNGRLDNFELVLGQLFEARSSKEYYILVNVGANKYSLVNIRGVSYWGEVATGDEIKKRLIKDIDSGILIPVKNQKIIIEGEI